jgi:hypothetical protein
MLATERHPLLAPGAGKQEEAQREPPRFSDLEGIAAVMFKELATNADG